MLSQDKNHHDPKTCVFLGSGGRVGRLLHAAWHAAPVYDGVAIWHGRRPGPRIDIVWDLRTPPPDDVCPPGAYVFVFAGVTPVGGGALNANTSLAIAAYEHARAMGARHVFVTSSSAVYGRGANGTHEEASATPTTEYGYEKQKMERALQGAAHNDCPMSILRIGNVAGAGEPFLSAARLGKQTALLDQFANGKGPARHFIGPLDLMRCLLALVRHSNNDVVLPEILNIAAPTATPMADIFDALGQPWTWRKAPKDAIQDLPLETKRLQQLYRFDEQAHHASCLVEQINRCGGIQI